MRARLRRLVFTWIAEDASHFRFGATVRWNRSRGTTPRRVFCSRCFLKQLSSPDFVRVAPVLSADRTRELYRNRHRVDIA